MTFSKGVACEGCSEHSTYPEGMARSHLTLAALATSAVPGLDIVETASFGGAGGDFDCALLTGRDGRHWLVRVPRNERAEAEQSADLVALRALSAGVRTRLHFSVSAFAGQTPINGTRAIVYEFVYGSKVPLGSLDVGQASSIGRAIAAIHALPTSFIADSGLPVLSALECLRACVTVIDRAAATGLGSGRAPLPLGEPRPRRPGCGNSSRRSSTARCPPTRCCSPAARSRGFSAGRTFVSAIRRET